MPLIFHSIKDQIKTYTLPADQMAGQKRLIDDMLKTLQTVPQPIIHSNLDGDIPTEQNTLTVLRAEYAFADLRHPANPFNYIAPIGLGSGFTVLFSSKHQHCLLHTALIHSWDASGQQYIRDFPELNLAGKLKEFTDGDIINVTIIGGSQSPHSVQLLRGLLASLLAVSGQYDLVIQFQLCCKANQFTNTDRALFLYDKIKEKAKYAARFFLNEDISHHEIFKKYKPRDLLTRHITDIAGLTQMTTMLELLNSAGSIMAPDEKSIPIIKSAISMSNDFFYNGLDAMFSQEAYQILEFQYKSMDIFPDTNLRNFALCLTSPGVVYQLSAHFPAPYFLERLATLFDRSQQKEMDSLRPCYNIAKRQYILYPLSQETIKFCDDIKKQFPRRQLHNKAQVRQKFAEKDLINLACQINPTAEVIYADAYKMPLAGQLQSLYFQPAEKTQPPSRNFKFNNRSYSHFYRDESFDHHPAIQSLKEHSSFPWKGKMRCISQNLLDTTLTYKTFSEAKQHQTLLDQTWPGITSYVLKFSDNPNYILCIPDITAPNIIAKIVANSADQKVPSLNG